VVECREGRKTTLASSAVKSPVALARRFHEQWVLEADPSEAFWDELVEQVQLGVTPQRLCAIHDVRTQVYEIALAQRPQLKAQVQRLFKEARPARERKATETIEWCVKNGVRLVR